MSKNGYNKPVEGVPTVGIYMDFMCPGCGNLNRNLDQDLVKMMDAGQINIDLHIMSFMGPLLVDQRRFEQCRRLLEPHRQCGNLRGRAR